MPIVHFNSCFEKSLNLVRPFGFSEQGVKFVICTISLFSYMV